MSISEKSLDGVEEVLRATITHMIEVHNESAKAVPIESTEEANAAGYMMGLWQGINIGVLDPKAANALREVYRNRVLAGSDEEVTDAAYGAGYGSVETIIGLIRKVIGNDA